VCRHVQRSAIGVMMNASASHSAGQTDAGRWMVARAGQLGFALAGVGPVRPSARAEFFRRWLAEGRHGDMAYLATTLAERLDAARVLPGCVSVLVVADRYAPRGHVDLPRSGALRGRVARYAWGRDYHRAMKRRMHVIADEMRLRHPGHEFRSCVDSAPVNERELAVAAGLGWIGKHTLLIHPVHGSWLLLGAMLTTLDLGGPDAAEADHCGTCTRCIDACPTKALEPYRIDARRCISYLTIEHRGVETAGFAPQMDQWLVGCDVCQEVCPHNSARGADHPASSPGVNHDPRFDGFDLLEVLLWDETARRIALRTSPMKRVKLELFKRNALVALWSRFVSTGEVRLRQAVEDCAWNAAEHPLVRQTARRLLGLAGG
jgi:epoxyqueuosine reductase